MRRQRESGSLDVWTIEMSSEEELYRGSGKTKHLHTCLPKRKEEKKKEGKKKKKKKATSEIQTSFGFADQAKIKLALEWC